LINTAVRSCHPSEGVFEFSHKYIQNKKQKTAMDIVPLCQDNVYVGMLLIAKNEGEDA
jgi:hypothetical protein